MNLKHIVAIAVIITGSVFAQNTPQVDKSNNIIFKAGIAYGFRFGAISPLRSRDLPQITENLSKGIAFDFGLYYRINGKAVVGFKYNRFSTSSATMDLYDSTMNFTSSQNDIISFYGASYLLDHKSRRSRHEFNLELALGYIDYRVSTYNLNNLKSYGGDVGYAANASYKYRVFNKLSVGPIFHFSGGTIKNSEETFTNSSGKTVTYIQQGDIALWRMDWGFEAIYRL